MADANLYESVTTSVTSELRERIVQDAADEERSVSAQLRRILRDHYAAKDAAAYSDVD